MSKTFSNIIAHLYRKGEEWVVQTLDNHALGVATLCSEFASEFGMQNWGMLIGILHDKGKEKMDFQRYIRKISGYDTEVGTYTDKSHNLVGAAMMRDLTHDSCLILSNCIAGHHRGLYDTDELRNKLVMDLPDEICRDFPSVKLERKSLNKEDISHLTRMLFSCLVDADYLDTERFINPDNFQTRGGGDSMLTLKCRLDNYVAGFKDCPTTIINSIRRKVQNLCLEKASAPPGFFELTVPTGGGKTIASVIWAVNHAVKHNKHRVVIAIPYTSIIVQTAQVLREIFGSENVLEHHSVVDESKISKDNKLGIENWDAPIVVTTNVQLFESMFSNRPSKCRKLHSLCNSVIVLDEAQSIPTSSLQPIVTAMRTYVRQFGVSFLFCTASQPVLSGTHKGLGEAVFNGLDSSSITPVVGSELPLHDMMRRVRIIMPEEKTDITHISTELSACQRVLCVVNTRRLALDIFRLLPDDGHNVHLSRMMCPAHISDVIGIIRKRLKEENVPLRVVSTQLIEAGVDIDFPVVYRQLSGLDSILQAAGRCNREGKSSEGVTYVFELRDSKQYGMQKFSTDAMRQLLSCHPDSDWFSPSVMETYYKIFYSKTPSFDKSSIDSRSSYPKEIEYEEIGRLFKLIDDNGIPVIVNYGESAKLVDRLTREGLSRGLSRQLSRFSVVVRDRQFKELLRDGMVTEPWPGVYYVPLKEQYDHMTGLKTSNEYIEQTFII